MPKNETAADSRQSVNLKWKLRKALEENVAPRDDGKGLDFGADVGVDGKLHLNALSDIVGPDGTALFTDGTQENVSDHLDLLYETYFSDKWSGADYVIGAGRLAHVNYLLSGFEGVIATGKCKNFVNCFYDAAILTREESWPSAIYVEDLPTDATSFSGMFDRIHSSSGTASVNLVLGNGGATYGNKLFGGTSDQGVATVSVAENKTFYAPNNFRNGCQGNAKLTSMKGIDFSRSSSLGLLFYDCSNLAEFDCPGVHASLDLSPTALGHDALVTVIANLETVTTAQTLTLGDEKLALLSDEEKLGATNKGWTLA